MKVRVVETVTSDSIAGLRAARDAATAGLVELRLDGVVDLDVRGALAGRRTPVVVTCRPAWEGGRFDGSEDERLAILAEAMRLGAEFVDLEWRADRTSLAAPGPNTQVILSHHDFDGIPHDLADRVRAMRAEAPAIVKVAVMPKHLGDCIRLRGLGRDADRHITIAMGAAGRLSRVCPWLFGSCWTYGGTAAPGQVGVRELLDLYRVETASASPQLYAVAGAPLAHSASPAMHNAAFAALDLDARYAPLETADIDELLDVCDAFGVAGVSVTAPLKPSAFARAASVDELAGATGSVNTLRRAAAGWDGRNFDVAGFLAPLERRAAALDAARVVVLGAGGAARTVIWAMRGKGAQVEVSARRFERARVLAEEFGVRAVAWPPTPGWDLLVNTTPVGTWPSTGDTPLDREAAAGARVYDLIYNPPETTLLAHAREAGADVIGGLEMLVSQACLQFEWWMGRAAPAPEMEAAARMFLARAQGTGQ